MKITVANIIKATDSKSAQEAAGKVKATRQTLYDWQKQGYISERSTRGPNIQNWHANFAKLKLSPTLEPL